MGVSVPHDSRLALSGQQGAALVLALIVIAVAVMAWQHRASLSHLVLVQESLDQASRAAAIGAARWHARTMNAHAMLNRTEMAHQVAMAHLLTLASAWEFRERMGQSAKRGNPPAHIIAMFFGADHAAAYTSAKLGKDRTALRDLKKAFERHDALLAGKLVRARQDLNRNIRQRTHELVGEILRRNLADRLGSRPGFTFEVENTHGLSRNVRQLQDMERWQRWSDAVMGRHDYLKSRADFRFSLAPFYPQCPILKHVLVRRGSTEIRVNGYWSSEDTLSYHSVRPLPEWCYYREYPMGWADAKVDPPPKRNRHDRFADVPPVTPVDAPYRFKNFRKWVIDLGSFAWSLLYPFNNQLAEFYGEDRRFIWKRKSLPIPYHLGRQRQSATIKVKVALQTRQLGQKAWQVRLNQPGLLKSDRPGWPSTLNAQAAAMVHFDNFTDADSTVSQAADLLQPFWVARLVLAEKSD